MGTIRRLEKVLIAPFRYRRRGGYDAERYWGDRFGRYGATPRASGHEGRSEDENRRWYAEATAIVGAAIEGAGVDLSGARVADVGCGPGFFTQMCADGGVTGYTGIDLTDVLFEDLRARFPSYRFERADITARGLPERFDVVLAIDVLEHVVAPDAFARAVANIWSLVADGGLLLVGPLAERRSRRKMFHLRPWSRAEFLDALGLDAVPAAQQRFGAGVLLAVRR